MKQPKNHLTNAEFFRVCQFLKGCLEEIKKIGAQDRVPEVIALIRQSLGIEIAEICGGRK